MSTVYLDARSLDPAHTFARARPSRGALAALAELASDGHPLVLVGEGPTLDAARAAIEEIPHRVSRDLPSEARGWLVTADPDLCMEAHRARGPRSILVGPTVPGRGLARRTWDSEARDLTAAALEILGAEAMPDGR